MRMVGCTRIASPQPSHASRSNGSSLGACGYIWVRLITSRRWSFAAHSRATQIGEE
jgi:hypothetical protein